MKPVVAIIGAGTSGLMVADYLSDYEVDVCVYEQMPSAGRKILWAGKTGLNITHSEPMVDFVGRYVPDDWLDAFLYRYDNAWLVAWLSALGVQTYTGSSGRVFPVEMKASPFLRAWLKRLLTHHVRFFYRHRCVAIDNNTLRLTTTDKHGQNTTFDKTFDAIILACGGGSYAKLGSTGTWQAWFADDELCPLYASNVGVVRAWSPFMNAYFGKALKRVAVWVDSPEQKSQGDIIISHYGMESGLIYKYNRQMRDDLARCGRICMMVDLLPDKHERDIEQILSQKKKSLNTLLQKAGLDKVKIALLRECTDKADWTNHQMMAKYIKQLPVIFTGFRPINEAISTGGGVKRSALTDGLQLKSNANVFCCGEMLDFDAPTGGYLLTACFATGRVVGESVAQHLNLSFKDKDKS